MRHQDFPQPPEDIELKNIIDKLAQFVARNGSEFEQMTKNKQHGNSKFQFLYGGEYYNYYQYKIEEEQAIFKKQQQTQFINQMPPLLMSPNQFQTEWNTPPPTLTPEQAKEVQQINLQIEFLRQEIKQSEQNLNAQHNVLLQQEHVAVEAAIAKCQKADLQKDLNECGLRLSEMLGILQPIINTCTKDSISNGKSWFLQHANTRQKAVCIVNFLLHRVLQCTTFSEKLHVIYLVNDLLHHSARKNASDLREQLELAVVPMFCNSSIVATEDQMQKLNKLVKIWQSKMDYLNADTLQKLRNPVKSYQQFQSEQMAKYAKEIAKLTNQTKETYAGYQLQHQTYVSHAMQRIADLEKHAQNIGYKNEPPKMSEPPPSIKAVKIIEDSAQQIDVSQPPPMQQTFPIEASAIEVEEVSNIPMPNFNVPPPNITVSRPDTEAQPDLRPPPPLDIDFSKPPLNFLPPLGILPDFSKPPPGFSPKIELSEFIPTSPYYDLPAGLMVPLVKLEDFQYKPLDPKDIRLPPPAPPNERLLAAFEAYYSLPSHERPRDSEGWEKLGLYEYYKVKNQARREKEDAIRDGLRIKSRSPSPIPMSMSNESCLKRRYRSKTPTPPPSLFGNNEGRGRRLKSRSRSRSRSKSRSRNRNRRSSRDRRDRRRRSYSRSRSRTPVRMSSLSPGEPSFGSNTELDASNKGHELLKKMGWSGRGLGAKEQGIDAPISGGDVRDRQDQYKGIGCNINDPFENFRKSKGVAFISRMKARDKEKETVAVSDRQ